jgi:hypothetical protein
LGGVDIPLLLPTKSNAILINLGDDAIKVPNLFQSILMRVLLSVRTDKLKVSVVDKDFGNSFPVFNAIQNSLLKKVTVDSQDGVNKLMEELSRKISEANRSFLGRYPDIEAYNEENAEMAFPYHYVFIDDFPECFTDYSMSSLERLIDNGNALRAGVRIFINFSEKNLKPREFDIAKIAKKCACITKDSNGQIVLDNFDINLPNHALAQIDLDLPQDVNAYVDYINNIKLASVSYSLDGWVENLKKTNQVWKSSTLEGIKVPVGFVSPLQHFDFYMANDKDGSCNDFFALLAGRPGYGKTVLLNNIIINAALKYSPDELCLYLADFAEGASFSIYRELPHAKALMLANSKEYALRMLKDLEQEVKVRSRLYQKAQKEHGRQVSKLSEYREVTGKKLPRIILIMDEFHTLFLSSDATSYAARDTLCNAIRQWRKFGISVILCTQTINGVKFGDDTDSLITYRFALNLLEMDSKTVIRNSAAKDLSRKGQTIMNNTSNGNVNANVEFQSAYSERYFDQVKYLAELYKQQYGKKHTPYICESEVDIDICDNPVMLETLLAANTEINPYYSDVYVGKPDLLRDTHTRIRYRRQQNSNTLILGDDYRVLIYNIMLQLLQLKNQSLPNSKFYIIDSFNPGDRYKGLLDAMAKLSERIVLVPSSSVANQIDEIYNELERRKTAQREDKQVGERVLLTIMNVQNTYELKPKAGKFGLEQSDTTKKLITILSEGAPLGIHCVIHGLSYETVFKNNAVFDNKCFSMFENLILLKGTDMGNIYVGGSSLKVAAPDEGRMIVVNSRVDGEVYESCKIYSDITTNLKNDAVEFVEDIFEMLRYE